MSSIDIPFHDGELIVQGRAGESSQAQRNASMISHSIPKAALSFLAQRCFVVIGTLDTSGYPWASVLVGEPGFIRTQNEHTVILDNRYRLSSQEDPVWNNIQSGVDIGVLAIDLTTRRRLRINGHIRPLQHLIQPLHGLVYNMAVDQAYPNCPKHIQKRQISLATYPEFIQPAKDTKGTVLEDHQVELIDCADTFFVASAKPGQGTDVSHRGGNPGFVQVLDRNRLRIPDYQGNSFFNTLGNFTAYPHAGLVFIDFERSRSLQVTGRVKILWDQQDSKNLTGGTGRYWELTITRWIETQLPRKLQSQLLEASPHNPVR